MRYYYLDYPDNFSWNAAKSISNGCGTDGWKGKIVPETMYGLNISIACDIHDFDYYFGMDWADKTEADNRFLDNLCRIIKHESKWWNCWLNPLRRIRAKEYHLAVKYFGSNAFIAGKEGFNNG